MYSTDASQIAATRSQRMRELVVDDFAAANAARRQAEETRLLELESRYAASASLASQGHLDLLNRSIAGIGA